jgi:hypothetical protein
MSWICYLNNFKLIIIGNLAIGLFLFWMSGCEMQQKPSTYAMFYLKNETRSTLIVTATDTKGQPATLNKSEFAPGEFAQLYSKPIAFSDPVKPTNTFQKLSVYLEYEHESTIKYSGVSDEDWQPDTLVISGNVVHTLKIY